MHLHRDETQQHEGSEKGDEQVTTPGLRTGGVEEDRGAHRLTATFRESEVRPTPTVEMKSFTCPLSSS